MLAARPLRDPVRGISLIRLRKFQCSESLMSTQTNPRKRLRRILLRDKLSMLPCMRSGDEIALLCRSL
jgi:hypothetical protein